MSGHRNMPDTKAPQDTFAAFGRLLAPLVAQPSPDVEALFQDWLDLATHADALVAADGCSHGTPQPPLLERITALPGLPPRDTWCDLRATPLNTNSTPDKHAKPPPCAWAARGPVSHQSVGLAAVEGATTPTTRLRPGHPCHPGPAHAGRCHARRSDGHRLAPALREPRSRCTRAKSATCWPSWSKTPRSWPRPAGRARRWPDGYLGHFTGGDVVA